MGLYLEFWKRWAGLFKGSSARLNSVLGLYLKTSVGLYDEFYYGFYLGYCSIDRIWFCILCYKRDKHTVEATSTMFLFYFVRSFNSIFILFLCTLYVLLKFFSWH